MPPKIPKTIRVHGLDFDIWQLGDGRYAFDYQDGTARRVVKRTTFDALRAEAERIALGIINASTAAKSMSADEQRIYIAARDALEPFGLDVDSAARMLADAARHAGGIGNVLDACRVFNAVGGKLRDATTAEIVSHFARYLSSDGVSEKNYLKPMEADLQKFAVRFPGAIRDIHTAEMEDWLRSLVKKDGSAIGARRRRNLRDGLVALFNFARVHDYLPKSLVTEAGKIKRPKVTRKAPAIYTPAELDLLITQSAQPADKKRGRKDYADFIPAICIAAFAGLRWSEILALEWSKIHWEDRVIEVGEEHKTGYRLVGIRGNLMSWLSPHRAAHGLVCGKHEKPDRILANLRRRAGLPTAARRYANALRHSCATYSVAADANMQKTAIELGHSVGELKKSYNRASLRTVAAAWFSITHNAGNVLQMPLMSIA